MITAYVTGLIVSLAIAIWLFNFRMKHGIKIKSVWPYVVLPFFSWITVTLQIAGFFYFGQELNIIRKK